MSWIAKCSQNFIPERALRVGPRPSLRHDQKQDLKIAPGAVCVVQSLLTPTIVVGLNSKGCT